MSSAVEIDKALRTAGAYLTPRLQKGAVYGNATVVDSVTESSNDASWSYDETYEAWAVFEVEGRLYRKTGYGDSWDAFGWDGALIEVSAETVEKIEYKPREVPALSGDAIEEFVQALDDNWYDISYYAKKNDIVTDWGTMKILEDEQGGEGHGESIWVIFELGGKIWRKDGVYASWVGSDWDIGSPYEVVGKPVERIEYTRV
jgi:hypothetical protein